MFADLPPRPFTVIAGFLGAGKTTLVNRILTQSTDTRYAVLVNDFGSINVDADLIAAHDGQTLALTNGCICCSMADGFIQTMLTLMSTPEAFDHVIVEASGVAEPSKIMDFARLDPLLAPDAIVTLIDAETLEQRLNDAQVGTVVAAQIRQGDLLILNKTDLGEGTACSPLINRLNPNAPLLQCRHADLPLGAVLGSGLSADQASPHPKSHAQFHSVVLQSKTPVGSDPFQDWAATLPKTVLRGKGRVHTTDQGVMIWQLVGQRSTLTPCSTDQHGTEIVLIATHPIDQVALPNTR